MELERDDQQTDDDVRQGEVGDKEVGDGLKNFRVNTRRYSDILSGIPKMKQSIPEKSNLSYFSQIPFIYPKLRILRGLTCMRRLVRTMKMTVELPRTAVREMAP